MATRTRKTVPTVSAFDLIQTEGAPRKPGDNRYLSEVTVTGVMDDMKTRLGTRAVVTEADAARVVAMVGRGLTASIQAAAQALAATTVDPSKVTLRSEDGLKVKCNVPVPYAVDGVTRYLNIAVSFDGAVGEILSAQAQRVEPTRRNVKPAADEAKPADKK